MVTQPAAEVPDDDPFGQIRVKRLTPLVTRERDEVDVLLVIVESSQDDDWVTVFGE